MLQLQELAHFTPIVSAMHLGEPPDLTRTATTAFADASIVGNLVQGFRALTATDGLWGPTFGRVLSFWERGDRLELPPGPLRTALFLYAAGGETYGPDAQALLDRLTALRTFEDRYSLLADWALMESGLIRRSIPGDLLPAVPEATREDAGLEIERADRGGAHFEQWLRLLNLEVTNLTGPQLALPRGSTDQEWNSQAHRFFLLVHGSPLKKGLLPRRLEERRRMLHGEIEARLESFFPSLPPETWEGLARRISRQLVRIEDSERDKLEDLEVSDFTQILLDHLAALQQTINEGKPLPELMILTLAKFSFGGIMAFFEWLDRELSKVPEAGEIAQTIAGVAFKARDPKDQATTYLVRWKEAYDAAIAGLKAVEEVGEIARTIAHIAFIAKDPKGQAAIYLARWQKAYDAAIAGLKEIKGAGKIARTIAGVAFTAEDPKGRAAIYLARWQKAYNAAIAGLGAVEGAGEIAKTIANAAFTAEDPKGRAAICLARWKKAYDAAIAGLKAVEEAGEIARTIANAAFKAEDSKGRVAICLARWQKAYDAAIAELGAVGGAGEIARKIANVAFTAEDPKGQAAICLARWKKAYDAAIAELGAVEGADEIAKMIASAVLTAEDLKAAVARYFETRGLHPT